MNNISPRPLSSMNFSAIEGGVEFAIAHSNLSPLYIHTFTPIAPYVQ